MGRLAAAMRRRRTLGHRGCRRGEPPSQSSRVGDPRLGLGVADRDRAHRPERAAQVRRSAVDHQGAVGHRDDHGVAHPDLRGTRPGPAATGTRTAAMSSPGAQGGALRADEELVDRQRPAPPGPRPARPGRRAPPAPAACRRRASRWPGCRRWCRCCGSAGCPPCGPPGPGRAAAPPARGRAASCRWWRRPGRPRRGRPRRRPGSTCQCAQLGQPAQREHVAGAAAPVVDLDHQVGAARQHGRAPGRRPGRPARRRVGRERGRSRRVEVGRLQRTVEFAHVTGR